MLKSTILTKEEKKMKKKLRAQVKSRFYYIFWGSATIAVVLGQLYVGTGYRAMARAIANFAETVIIESERLDLQRGDDGFLY
tara:strand:- start:12 stop:257 length:246 start_codon:yes stop_codon:yes gene_type:complete